MEASVSGQYIRKGHIEVDGYVGANMDDTNYRKYIGTVPQIVWFSKRMGMNLVDDAREWVERLKMLRLGYLLDNLSQEGMRDVVHMMRVNASLIWTEAEENGWKSSRERGRNISLPIVQKATNYLFEELGKTKKTNPYHAVLYRGVVLWSRIYTQLLVNSKGVACKLCGKAIRPFNGVSL